MRDQRDALVHAALARWPEHDWPAATSHHGAFHLVLTLPDGPTLRAVLGQRGQERSEREAGTLTAVGAAAMPVPVPHVLDGPHQDDATGLWMTLLSTVPGVPTSDLDSCTDQRLRQYAGLLGALRAASPAVGGSLPPVRAWCGGEDWPHIVRCDLLPRLSRSAAAVAEQRVQGVLEAEQGIEPVLCHGDFGPHNILWAQGSAASLIDLDHACLGDPAIDLAPLIGFHGATRVAELAAPEVIERARAHRATLPLQVAAAAQLAGIGQLRDHALGNVERRVAEGTLFDPELTSGGPGRAPSPT